MNKTVEDFFAIFTLVGTIAIVAVVVSKNANTSGIIKSLFSGFSGSLAAATAPVTGNSGMVTIG